MPRNPAGKWVARAGATGGSRTYRGQTPINWYAALTIIVVLGVLSVVFAMYEYRNPGAGATTTTPPTTKTTWYAGINFNICGKVQPNLASNATSTGSSKAFFTTGDGVITVSPKTDTEAGKNAVLGKFVSGYHGLTLSATQLGLPPSTTAKHSSSTTSTIYKNGDKCPKGTPDAGQTAEVQVTYWPSATLQSAKAKTATGDPSTLRFTHNQLITVGFVPPGTKLAKPNSSIILAVLQKGSATSTSTTAASGAVTTTPTTSSTATTAASSSTTASSTATTVAPTTTTTSKK
jgi:hypothetical protein